MNLQDLFFILRARWRIVAGATLLAVVAVGIVNFILPKQYRAWTTVVVDVKGADPIASSNAQTQVVPGYLATQVGIVSSDRVIQRVINAVKLKQDPEMILLWQQEADGLGSFNDWLTARLVRKLDVRPAHEGSLIDIAIKWENAERAAEIANAFARAYIDTNLELKVEPAKQYASWFEERNQALRKDVEESQQRLSDYQRKRGIIAVTDARLDVENARLNELSSQLTALQGTRADSASRQRQAGMGRDIMPEVLQNPVVISLKGELARLESRRADMTSRYGRNYPDIQRLNSEVSAMRERVNEEINRVASSLGAANQINVARETEIRGAVEAQRQRVLELSQQRDDIAVLQNDVANARRAYDTVMQRFAQTSLESQNQTTNVMVVTPAVESLFPDSPRVKVNLALALVFGSLFGIALALFVERLDQRIHGADHLRTVLAAPVFGVLAQTAAISTKRPKRLTLKW